VRHSKSLPARRSPLIVELSACLHPNLRSLEQVMGSISGADDKLRRLVTASEGVCVFVSGLADAYEALESPAMVSLAARYGCNSNNVAAVGGGGSPEIDGAAVGALMVGASGAMSGGGASTKARKPPRPSSVTQVAPAALTRGAVESAKPAAGFTGAAAAAAQALPELCGPFAPIGEILANFAAASTDCKTCAIDKRLASEFRALVGVDGTARNTVTTAAGAPSNVFVFAPLPAPNTTTAGGTAGAAKAVSLPRSLKVLLAGRSGCPYAGHFIELQLTVRAFGTLACSF